MSTSPASDKNELTPETAGSARREKRFIWPKRVLGILAICLIILFIALQTSYVQNKFAQFFVSQISEQLDTRVELKSIDLNFFDNVHLNDFTLFDEQEDTLIAVQTMQVSLIRSLFSLIRNRLDLNIVHLDGVQLNLLRQSGQERNNLSLLLQKLTPDLEQDTTQVKAKENGLLFGINELVLSNITVHNVDSLKGAEHHVKLSHGTLTFEKIDGDSVVLSNIYLSNPEVHLVNFNPIWSGTKEENMSENGNVQDNAVDEKPGLKIIAKLFELENGLLRLDNYRKTAVRIKPENAVDFNFLDLKDINISIRDFSVRDMDFRGKVDKLHAYESSGFLLEDLRAADARVHPKGIELYGLSIVTPYSEIGDTLIFKYKSYDDFNSFEDRVRLDGRFSNTEVAFIDIGFFAPNLTKNSFVESNIYEKASLNGHIQGRMNRLRGDNIQLNLASGVAFEGKFRTRNITVKDDEHVNLELHRLQTDMIVLRSLLPNFNPPAQYDKLGRLNFSGEFDGYFYDFVAYGTLQSDLGTAKMDMHLNTIEGMSNATYSGGLDLNNFDLKTWSGNDNFDRITFTSKVLNGVGLSGSDIKASINSSVSSFSYKDYEYANFDVNGVLSQEQFDGTFSIDDENLKFLFTGLVDVSSQEPIFDFHADVENINLYALNLSKKPLEISGVLDLEVVGNQLKNIRGNAAVDDVVLKYENNTYNIDSLNLYSTIYDSTYREFYVDSELLEANIKGNFHLEDIPRVTKNYLNEKYPNLLELEVKPKAELSRPVFDFTYDIRVHDAKGLTQIIDPQLDNLKNLEISGSFREALDELEVNARTPQIQYGNLKINKALIYSSLVGGMTNVNIGGIQVNNRSIEHPFAINATASSDTVDFQISYVDQTSNRPVVNLNGLFAPIGDKYLLKITGEEAVFFGERFNIQKNNSIIFNKDYLDLEDFVVSYDSMQIELDDIDNTGLQAKVSNFALTWIDSLWNYDKLYFLGSANLSLSVENVFDLSNFDLRLASHDIKINNDRFGTLAVAANTPNLKSPINADLKLGNVDSLLVATGFYNHKNVENSTLLDYLDIGVEVGNYPFDILSYFVADISDTEGLFNGRLNLKGHPSDLNVDGWINVIEAATTLDYLQTRYFLRNETAIVTNDLIDLTGSTLYDKFGNTAYVFGGITHKSLAKLGLDLVVSSPEFLILDTKKNDNQQYYGTGIGEMTTSFGGTFQKPTIDVVGKTGKNTHIYIPISSNNLPNELSFIKFVDLKSSNDENFIAEEEQKLGPNLEMDLTMTEDAQVELIFDERAGDIIRGNGNGNLSMKVNPTGEMTMLGNYEIAEGEYLFTLYNFINKPFLLEEGGRIEWTGDPFNADIDIRAEYKGLSAPVYNLISEFLSDEEIKVEARQTTPVDLTMILTGQLLKPDINFDIELPDIQGRLQSAVSNKMNILRADQNELNRQVFGLLVVGGFLPTSQGAGQGKEILTGVNTVTEFLSNQLSIYLTELISEVFADVGFISGIDFDIAYNVYHYDETLTSTSNLETSGDFSQNVKLNLFNDRVTLNVGGNFDFDLNKAYLPAGGTWAGADVVLEYVVTKDRKLKIKAYNKNDRTIGGNRRKSGGGLSFRHEFENFKELFMGKKKKKGETNSVLSDPLQSN